MTLHVPRAILQLVYLEQHPSPRAPNVLNELLGAINVRGAGEAAPPERKTLDLHGAASIVDDPLERVLKISCGGDVICEAAVSGTIHNFTAPLFDDASMVVFTLDGDTTISSLDAFSCRRWEKLLINRTGGALTLLHSSSAGFNDNRVLAATGADLVINPGGAAWLFRDAASTRWRAKISNAGDIGALLVGQLDFEDPQQSAHLQTAHSQ